MNTSEETPSNTGQNTGPGGFNNTRVVLREPFTAADGYPLYATQEWVLFSYDKHTQSYLAYEVDGPGSTHAIRHSEVSGRAFIVDYN